MLAHPILVCVLIGSVLQSSYCQGKLKDAEEGKLTDAEEGKLTDAEEGKLTDAEEEPVCLSEEPVCLSEEPVFLSEEDVIPYRESITWDAETAHPNLTLTGDWKTATLGNNRRNIDNNTKRFDKDTCILGSAKYQSGKHYWLVGGKGGWLVGVAAESVQRKGLLMLDPSAGIYVIARSVDEKPEKVGIFLDCDKKHVSFLDASTREVLLGIDITSTEPVHPFALIGTGSITVE